MYPLFLSREPEDLGDWIHYSYPESYMQDALPSEADEQSGIMMYYRQANRMFQHLTNENASGVIKLGFGVPSRITAQVFTLLYLVFPIYMIVTMGKQYCIERKNKAQD
jgi:hypothetical protein